MKMRQEKKRKKLIGALGMAALTGTWQASAQEPARADESLGEVVVTASRIEQHSLEAPASVSVVSAEKLEETGAARPTDALTARVPGFYWRGPTGIADRAITGSTHSLRGQNLSRVKIMLDGVSLADGNSGQNRSLVGIEMDDIERIEVVPGVSSALYGSDAIGGVVNVITKVPTKQEINAKYIHGFDEVKRDGYSASYRNRWENGLALSFSAGYEEREGSRKQNQVWSATKSYASRDPKDVSTNTKGDPTYLIGDSGAIPSRISRVNARIFYELDRKSRFYAGFGYFEAKQGYRNYHQYISGPAVTGTTLWNTSAPTYNEEYRYFAGYDGKLGQNFDLNANISYAKQDYYYVTSLSGATFNGGLGYQTGTPSNNLEGSIQLGSAIGQKQYLILGLSSARNELDRKSYNVSNWRHPEGHHTGLRDTTDADSRINAFFIQDQIFVTDALTLYAGGRYDKWTSDGTVWNSVGTLKSKASKSAFSPKLAVVYRWNDTLSFRASVGKAFRAPTNNDMYALSRSTDKNGTSGARILVPDPGVKPETATAIDFGVEKALPGNGFVKAAVYRTKLKDMLYRKVFPSDGSYDYLGGVPITELSRMTNAGESLTKGIELSGEMPLASWLRASASYTWTDAKITKDDTGASLKGKFVRYVPKNMASIGLDARWRDWSANLMTTYVGKRYGQEDNSDRVENVYGGSAKYWLSNLRVGYRIDKNFKATLAINNLFDKKYYEYYLMPGRNVSLEIRAAF
ncbi:MAG: TonB-dependent receptor [Candidatus Accumulibacter sp.]|jgi:iron complex outermembrane receptor protein|nr:TonB-dependent receptor [Accumulibacter sp.]